MDGIKIGDTTDFYKIEDSITPIKDIGVIRVIEHPELKAEFSFVVPTFNRADLLKECVDSILGQKNIDNYNLFVIDNNPERNDATEQLMLGYKDDSRVNYFKNSENLGMVKNWNRTFWFATGDWVIELHDDDFVADNYLQRIKHYMTKYPGYSMYVPGHYEYINGELVYSNGFLRNLLVKLKPCWRVVAMDYIGGCKTIPTGSVYNRSDFIMSGGFNPEHGPAADYSFFAGYSKSHRILRINEYLIYYRILRNVASNHVSDNKLKYTSHYVSKFFLEHELSLPQAYQRKYSAHRLATRGGGWEQASEYLDELELDKYKAIKHTKFIFDIINSYISLCSLLRRA